MDDRYFGYDTKLKQNNSKWPDLNVNAPDQIFLSFPPQFCDYKIVANFSKKIIKVHKFTLLKKSQFFRQKSRKRNCWKESMAHDKIIKINDKDEEQKLHL